MGRAVPSNSRGKEPLANSAGPRGPFRQLGKAKVWGPELTTANSTASRPVSFYHCRRDCPTTARSGACKGVPRRCRWCGSVGVDAVPLRFGAPLQPGKIRRGCCGGPSAVAGGCRFWWHFTGSPDAWPLRRRGKGARTAGAVPVDVLPAATAIPTRSVGLSSVLGMVAGMVGNQKFSTPEIKKAK